MIDGSSNSPSMRSKPTKCLGLACCARKHLSWFARRSGRCCWLTTRCGISCTKPPTISVKILTDSPSSAVFVSSAARSPTRRVFPPHRLDRALQETREEIQERLNPPRRNRTYPRVVKRHRSIDRRIKRPHHRQILHDSPPQLHIFA